MEREIEWEEDMIEAMKRKETVGEKREEEMENKMKEKI